MKSTKEAVKEKMTSMSASMKESMEIASADAKATAQVLMHPTNKYVSFHICKHPSQVFPRHRHFIRSIHGVLDQFLSFPSSLPQGGQGVSSRGSQGAQGRGQGEGGTEEGRGAAEEGSRSGSIADRGR